MAVLDAWYVRDEALTVIGRPRPREIVPERRAAPRLPIEVDVDVEGPAQRFRTSTRDLSTGGMFLLTHRDIPIGTQVMLCFRLPSGTSLEVNGVVKWRRDDYLGEGSPGIGVAFADLGPEVKGLVERFCKVREPLYSTPDDALDD